MFFVSRKVPIQIKAVNVPGREWNPNWWSFRVHLWR